MRAAQLLLATALLAVAPGCTSLPMGEAPLILVRDTVWLNATAEDGLLADVGGHCTEVTYEHDPPQATLIARGALLPPAGPTPGAVLVRQYDARGTAELSILGTAAKLYTPDANGALRLESPVNNSRALLLVNVSGDAVTVNGEALAPGEKWNATFQYAGAQRGATYNATHHVRVEHLGEARLRSRTANACE